MSIIEDLNREVAQDMERARARLAAVEVLDYAAAQLRAGGFAPELARDAGGMVVLRVDLDKVAAVAPSEDGPRPRSAFEMDKVFGILPEPVGFTAGPDAGIVSVPGPVVFHIGGEDPAAPEDDLRSELPPDPEPDPDPDAAAGPILGPIEGAEREEALDLLADGVKPAEVARILNRKPKQLQNLKYKNSEEIEARRARRAAAVDPDPEPASEPERAPSPEPDPDPEPGLSGASQSEPDPEPEPVGQTGSASPAQNGTAGCASAGAAGAPAGPPAPRPVPPPFPAAGAADRMPWPADWWDRRDPGDARACRALWATVLYVCIHAALKSALGRPDNRSHLNVNDRVALDWIGSRDFHMVCALAGMDGDALRDAITRQAARPGGLAEMLGRFPHTRGKA